MNRTPLGIRKNQWMLMGGPMTDKKRAMLALLLLVPVPSIGVWAAMYSDSLRESGFGQVIYGCSKVWILILPLIWQKLVVKKPFEVNRPAGMAFGWISGIVLGLVIIGFYFLLGTNLIDADVMKAAAADNGLSDPMKYLFLAAYLSLVNSLLEEMVWRWFVQEQWMALVSERLAVLLAAACFTLHHVFALKAQMSWTATILASFGVFVGGCIWSWTRARYKNVWSGYVSHLLVDVAIFWVGWLILF